MKLRVRLRELREAARLSLREAAARLNKSPGYISRVEGRGEIPSTELLCELAVLYSADIEELLDLAKEAQLRTTAQQIENKHNEALRLFRLKKEKQ